MSLEIPKKVKTSNFDEESNSKLFVSTLIDKIAYFLNNLGPKNPLKIKELENYYSKHFSTVNYDAYAVAFNQAYFIQNFIKYLHVFEKQAPPTVNQVIDLGSGMGPLSLAYLVHLECNLRKTHFLTITLIDKSTKQLALAKEFFKFIGNSFTTVKFHPKFIHRNLITSDSKELSADLILLGHVLNENPSGNLLLIDRILSLNPELKGIYIVERKDDPIWKLIECHLGKLGISYKPGITEDAQPVESIFNLKMNLSSKFIFINKNTLRLSRMLLYFLAWKDRSLSSLDNVFTVNAKYYDKAGKIPYEGIHEIKQYWIDNVLPQEKIELQIKRIKDLTNEIIIEWSAKFKKMNDLIRLTGDMVLKFDYSLGKFSELRENYVSKKTPIKYD